MIKIILLALLFVSAVGAAYAVYEKSRNAKLKHYANPPGSPVVIAPKEEWRKFFMDRMFDHEKVVIPAGFVIPERQVLAKLGSLKDQNSVTWLGHAAFLVHLDGKYILTDPWLSPRASPFRYLFGPKRFTPPGISVENLPPIDMLLISHNHYDHLDKETLRKLPNKDKMTVLTPSGNAQVLRPLGFQNIIELDWGAKAPAENFEVTVMPAIHFSARTLWNENTMLWGGFSVKGAHQKFYFSGDTTYGPVFKDMAKYGPFDFGMIGIGAYDPVALMKGAHATPEQAIEIAKDLHVKTVIGMHWGSVRLTNEPSFEPPVRFEKAGQEAGFEPGHIWAMKIGETRQLN